MYMFNVLDHERKRQNEREFYFIPWVVPPSCKKPRALRFGDQTSAPTSYQMSPHVPTDHSILSNVPNLRLVSLSQCPTLRMAFVVKPPPPLRPPSPPPSGFTLIGALNRQV
jgi:hypothetical protein